MPDVDSTTATVTMILGITGVVLSVPAWLFFLRGARGLWKFITSGTPLPGRFNRPFTRLATLVKEVVFHSEMARKPAVAIAHWFVMVGFLVGFILWFEAYIQTFNPHGGWPVVSHWPIYHLLDEILGLGTVLGIMFLVLVRLNSRVKERLSRFYGSNQLAARFVEAVVFVEGAGMILVKAGKIATYPDHTPNPWTDFVTMHVATLLPASAIMVSCFALMKLLSGLVWLFVVGKQLSWGVAWHRFLAFFTIFLQKNPDGSNALGPVQPMYSSGRPITLDTADPDTDTIGVGHLPDASWKMLLDSATCTECGRCQEMCPAWNTGKPLSPKKFMIDIRDAAIKNSSYLVDPSLLEGTQDDAHAGLDVLRMTGRSAIIDPDELWSCTNCGACVEQCPVDIEHIDHITNLRRFEVLIESEFPSELTGMFKNLETKKNPWGRNAKDREDWISKARKNGVDVPVLGEDVTDFSDLEYLFWVGCAGAFDDQAVKTTVAVVELLHTAGVKFAVLGKAEGCTGDPARRAGNEFLFQMLAEDNIALLNDTFDGVPKGQRKIITTCPHCFNTLRNEYPDFDGHFDVFHHTQLLNRLVRDGLLTPVPRTDKNRKPVTYHDPCFLGRHNKVFDPPRELIGATGADLKEMDRNKNQGFCCGAGGARMFMEEKLGTRIADNRAEEAVATGAEEIAVGCPFCNVMLTGGVKAVSDAPADEQPVVKDVAQMLRDNVLVDGKLPTPRDKQFLEPPTRGLTDLGLTSVRHLPPTADSEKTKTKPQQQTPVTPSPAKDNQPSGAATPGTATPRPTVPQAPGAAKPAAPGSARAATPKAPGTATPRPTVPQAPGSAKPAAPGSAKPAAPGSVRPAAPKAPGAAKPKNITPQAPGGAKPAEPGSAKPAAPGSVRPAAPKAPGAAKPKNITPQAPGGAKPAAPGSARPATPKAPGTATPIPAAPKAPGAAKPKAPGSAKPAAPGSAKPAAPGSVRPAAPKAPGAAKPGGIRPPGAAKPVTNDKE
ncbi:heterodisulfide reductase-related iron-sulfur binding cluster [Corynebacterium mendelii]|uniref:4Fe-4S dicluster domain-containing protein n=1 Tax=Corynebacterium mendelii TaxID=2765362 RepID=A0A939E2B5_9CORY|nr:(Fe-S)-binding protein [Corynebacterium mendelii]MBN9645206.1 4Fe-4S dicluster domain-containing protein [Corynebacterium mendelii]